MTCLCKFCRPRGSIVIKQPLIGYGDGLLGLMAVAGYKKQFPESSIEYQVSAHTLSLISMFDAGQEKTVTLNDTPATFTFEKCHDGETRNVRRGDRYKKELGIEELILPILKNKNNLQQDGISWYNSIALAPFASSGARDYFHMPEVCKLLKENHRVVVLHDKSVGRRRIYNEQVINQSWETVCSIILNCKLLIGVDTGLTHLAAILGRPTLILSGPIWGETVYSCYPNPHYLYGTLPCTGCFWRPLEFSDKCQPCCPSLKLLSPERVVEKVDEILSV